MIRIDLTHDWQYLNGANISADSWYPDEPGRIGQIGRMKEESGLLIVKT